VKERDFKNWSPLRIFISYFSNHKLLFAIDVLCACGIAAVDLLFPLITRQALIAAGDIKPISDEVKNRRKTKLVAAQNKEE
jgi:hypothetical protein